MEITTLPGAGLAPAQQLKPAARAADKDPAQVRKVSQEFEAMFVGMMLKSMRESVGTNKLTGGGRGEETFQSLLDQEYATKAAQSGGIGLARTLERELNRGNAPVKGVSHAY